MAFLAPVQCSLGQYGDIKLGLGRRDMANTTNSILCELIVDILQKGECSTSDIQAEIRLWLRTSIMRLVNCLTKKGKDLPSVNTLMEHCRA